MLAAARRTLLLLAAIGAITLAGSVLAALVLDVDYARAIATGFYVVGAFVVIVGFLSGARGPLRPKSDPEDRDAVSAMFGFGVSSRGVRAATEEERADAVGTAGLFVILGLALIAIGVIADTRFDLV
jgi:hypothetical protein